MKRGRADQLTQSALGPSAAGFTLIELVVVVAIIGILSTLAISKLGSVTGWTQKSEVRAIVNVWEFLLSESGSRKNSYRLVLNLDSNSYFVRREVPLERTKARQVDYLQNLRTRGEKARRQVLDEENIMSLDEELRAEDDRQSAPLEAIYFDTLFADPEEAKRLAVPIEFPALAETKTLPDGVRIRDIKTPQGRFDKGEVRFRFSPAMTADPALIHFEFAGGGVMSALINPGMGGAQILEGDFDFDFGSKAKAGAG